MEIKKYLVYKHTNKINNKVYVGITSQTSTARWKNGRGYKDQERFYNAILKYGWDNFEHKILIHGLTEEQASRWEKKLIKFWNTQDKKLGYNIQDGGYNNPMTEETKIKIRNAVMGKNNGMYGKKGYLHHQSKSVICLNNNKIYDSVSTAERELNTTHISACCRLERSHTKGLSFLFYSDYLKLSKEDINKILSNNKKSFTAKRVKIKCIEDNKEFDSISDASKYYKISHQIISKKLKKNKKINGKTFIKL